MVLSLLLAATLATAVDAPDQLLAPAEISRAVVSGIRTRLATEGSAAKVEVVGRIRAQRLPVGKVKVELGEIGGRWPRERVGVPVQLRVDGQPVRSMTVWLELHDEREVPTYAISYPAHTAGSDIRTEPAVVDMICCPGLTVASASDLQGQRIARPVRAGTPVMVRDLEAVPDVLAQSEVAIVVRRGPVRIMTSGVALGDGEIGEVISVRPDHSRVAIRSRVVADQKVVVDE